jgi:hypothetical protein
MDMTATGHRAPGDGAEVVRHVLVAPVGSDLDAVELIEQRRRTGQHPQLPAGGVLSQFRPQRTELAKRFVRRVADPGRRFGLRFCQLPLEIPLLVFGGVDDVRGRVGQASRLVHDEEFFFDPESQTVR